MSDSVISRDNFPQGIAIGAYACLFLTMCFFFASWLLVAAIPAIAFIVMLYRAGDDVSHDHAVYARNTLIFFAIALVASFIVLMAAILVIATSQADVAFMEQLEADMSAGNMSAQEFLSSVAGSGMFKKIAIAFAICIALLLWPLQRCIVGTLRAVYALPAAGSSVALHVVAVVIGIIWYALVMFVF